MGVCPSPVMPKGHIPYYQLLFLSELGKETPMKQA
jgi:hypothetical protein